MVPAPVNEQLAASMMDSPLSKALAADASIASFQDHSLRCKGARIERGAKILHPYTDWEGALKGRLVNMPKVKAHSGASILPEDGHGRPCHGEVDFFSPTIHAQLDDAVRGYRAAATDLRSIDLVLIDGRINDLGVFNLIQPFISKKKIAKDTNDYCYLAMKDLLREVVTTFCNARVVVTGYFPVISRQTAPDTFLRLFLLAFGEKKLITSFGIAVFNLLRKGIGLKKLQPGPILNHAAELSDLWYTESTLSSPSNTPVDRS